MSNQITPDGIETQSYNEIVTELVDGFKVIYGSDINVDSNTPDGQLINIFALAKKDILDLITADYTAKDPDQAVGTALDGLAQLCGLFRKGGSYTQTDIIITVDRSLNLVGLDQPSLTPFTVSDSVGNQFYLVESAECDPGDNTLRFRAKDIGQVQVLPNTIVVPVTVVLGVTNINNPAAPVSTGTNQETDAQFRVRRQQSIAAPSQGFLQGLRGGLLALDGVIEAVVYENNTSTLNPDDVPGHSIWVIVDGGSDQDIAEAIYKWRNAGCGMRGDEAVTITQIDGTSFVVYFDRALDENLYIDLEVESMSGSGIDLAYLKEQLVAQYVLGIYDPADVTSIAALVKEINSDVVIVNAGVSSDNLVFSSLEFPSAKKNRFVLTAPNIEILTSGSSSSSSHSSSSSSCRSSSSSCRSSSSSTSV